MRVYELAKELGVSNKELVARTKELGMPRKNNFSGLEDEEVASLRAAFGKAEEVEAKPAAKADKKKTRAAAKTATRKKTAKSAKAGTTAKGKAAAKTKAREKPKKAEKPEAEKAPEPKAAEPEAKAPAEAKTEEPAAPKSAEAQAEQEEKKSEEEEKRQGKKRVKTKHEEEEEQRQARKRRSRPKPAWRRQQSRADEPVIEQEIHKPGTIQATPITARRLPRKRKSVRRLKRSALAQVKQQKEFTVEVPITVKDLSAEIGVKASNIIYRLMQLGPMVTMNTSLGQDEIDLLAQEFNLTIHTRAPETAEDIATEALHAEDKAEDLQPRAPVVTFLGHVDHGKTSLLDKIRKSDVVSGEHGGITQHIGAYRVTIDNRTVVFLDTPGHEAFTSMRSRGANVTDIAVLVVAADDGVMPQTQEAIDHARAAGVQIVVAINKCDKPEANTDRVKQQLTGAGLQPEEWGGDTVCVEVSAMTGQGVDELMEMLALVAELRELKANPSRPASGTVLEAQISESRGPVATVLVQSGTLRVGDVVVIGRAFGRVKALVDDHGRDIEEAGPTWPVTVVGLNTVPDAGDRLIVLDDIQQARTITEERSAKARAASVAQRRHVSLENFFDSLQEGETRELVLILKADVHGTIEALSKVVSGLDTKEVKVNVLRASPGQVSTSDVLLADASDAIVIGLNVGVDPVARTLAEEKGVSIRVYNVIYRVKEEIERALVGMLKPKEREVVTGHATVRQIFRISRYGTIAGCYVTDGVIGRNHRARLLRDGAVVHTGRLDSLRRVKDDVREVRDGFECGMHIEGYDDVKEGDVIETFQIEQVARTLEEAREQAS